MKLISCHHGMLQELVGESLTSHASGFSTDLGAWDSLLPARLFSKAAIHELLSEKENARGFFPASFLARQAAAQRGAIVWCETVPNLYPPALAASDFPLDRLFLVRATSEKDLIWAAGEALRCKGVAATIANLGKLSRIQARRLQLAAEEGGGVGIFMRPKKLATEYAAATRWLVRPARGDGAVQRWSLQLLHGHGGRVGHSIILEAGRETDSVRAFEAVEHRPLPAEIAV